MAKNAKKPEILSLKERNFIKKKLNVNSIKDLDVELLKQLKESLKKLKDKRQKSKVIYKFWDVIMYVIIASFADCDEWEYIHDFIVDNKKWFKSFLQMTGGIPSAETIERIISLIDSKELEKILFEFFETITFTPSLNSKLVELSDDDIYNFDGRVNNGSKRASTIMNEDVKPLNVLNVYSNKNKYCMLSVPIDSKTNEIPTVKTILQGINLNNTIVTWDALNTQTFNAEAVIDAGGNYIIPIKGNQGSFQEDLKLYFDEEKLEQIKAGNSQSEYASEIEKSHSKIIKYEFFQTSDIDWYHKINDWKGIKSIGLVKKTITEMKSVDNKRKNAKKKKVLKEVTTEEVRYYISSKFVNIDEFKVVTRNHWSIENKLHWHLDFTFSQDKNQTTNKQALLNLEIIHKFVLATLERVKKRYGKSIKGIRKHLTNNFSEFFPELLAYLIVSND